MTPLHKLKVLGKKDFHILKFDILPLRQPRLNYCNVLLAGLPSCRIKPLQMIQNAAARLVFSKPKRVHVTPLFVSLHWLPVAARIKFKTLMLAYRTTTGSAPTYFHSLITIYIPFRSLRSASEYVLAIIIIILQRRCRMILVDVAGQIQTPAWAPLLEY